MKNLSIMKNLFFASLVIVVSIVIINPIDYTIPTKNMRNSLGESHSLLKFYSYCFLSPDGLFVISSTGFAYEPPSKKERDAECISLSDIAKKNREEKRQQEVSWCNANSINSMTLKEYNTCQKLLDN